MDKFLAHYEEAARRKVLTRSLKGRFLLGVEGVRKKNWLVLYLLALPGDIAIVLSKHIGRFIARHQARGDRVLEKQLRLVWAWVLILFLVATVLSLVGLMEETPFIEKFIVFGSLFAVGVSALTVVVGRQRLP